MGALVRRCEFSHDRVYRYTLWREWAQEDLFSPRHSKRTVGYAMFIGLNPSTADETQDDPTIRRCIAFAHGWGFGALCMCNLYAYRATQPKDMLAAADPVGPDNRKWLALCAAGADIIIAAWGGNADKAHAAEICATLPGMYCLNQNADGTPQHPLYVPGSAKPYEYFL